MKKLFITIVMAFMAMVGYAQTTFNVRAGGGVFQTYDGYEARSYGGGALTFETNIPLGSKASRFVLSPSTLITLGFIDSDLTCGLNIPVHFGYKIQLNDGGLFIPKIGPMVGYVIDNDYNFGPSSEFAFEFNHFVVAANGYYDVIHEGFGVFCTVGYKF